MDEEASNGAWRSYENISKNYTLEVRESYLLLHRARCGHHAGMSMQSGALMCLCVHLNASIGLITKRSTVCVCVCACGVYQLLIQRKGAGFRARSSHRPYLSQHSELICLSHELLLKAEHGYNTVISYRSSAPLKHSSVNDVTGFMLASSLLSASYSESTLYLFKLFCRCFLNYFISYSIILNAFMNQYFIFTFIYIFIEMTHKVLRYTINYCLND